MSIEKYFEIHPELKEVYLFNNGEFYNKKLYAEQRKTRTSEEYKVIDRELKESSNTVPVPASTTTIEPVKVKKTGSVKKTKK